MKIDIPQLSLVLLVGPSGSGKSTFAGRHFLPTEVVSSDACRGLISDDPDDQSVTAEAFDLLRTIAPGDAFILGVADNVMAEAKIERIARVTEMVEQYGAYPIQIP